MSTAAELAPADAGAVADAVTRAARDRTPLRIAGGATKAGWGAPVDAPLTLSTRALAGVVDHRPGDFVVTAGAGTRLTELAAALAAESQMLTLDPPDPDGRATLGGVLAAADSGPLRHRYGGPRDVLLGVRVVLGDGALVRSGSTVIKNVAGYDLGRLMGGAFGTLGVVVELTVRVHPLPDRRVTVRAMGDDAARLAAAISELNRRPLEAEAIDARWEAGRGTLLVRLSGSAPDARAEAVAATLARHGLACALLDDPDAEALAWAQQRTAQRSAGGCVVRIAAAPSAADHVLALAADPARRLVGRAGVGTWWLTLPAAGTDELSAAVAEVRVRLRGAQCVVTDAPAAVRAAAAWPAPTPAVAALTRRLREQFDPAGVLNPGVLGTADG